MNNLIISVLKILHWVLVVYSLVGWLPSSSAWLMVYLIYVPVMVGHWHLNQNVCIVNTIESKLMTGQWRAPDENPEEGGFVRANFEKWFGIEVDARAYDIGIRVLLGILWLVALQKYLAL
jgi:hypothetical protein